VIRGRQEWRRGTLEHVRQVSMVGPRLATKANMLNRQAAFALSLFALVCGSFSAQETNAQQRFTGTWEAKFKGDVFLTVQLNAGRTMTGTLSTGNITVNDEGDLIEAHPSPNGTQSDILSAKIDGNRLTFEIEEDGEAMKLELKITGEGRGELAFLTAPGKIKPIRVERK
jgi:hypothetical protein